MSNIINIINTYDIYWYTACGSGKKYKNCHGRNA
ncbi:MAG: SEC-C domain-containing protein [Clostridia bacterium]|nr:SEC-C domain-containing protein [Clostridia bacterium]